MRSSWSKASGLVGKPVLAGLVLVQIPQRIRIPVMRLHLAEIAAAQQDHDASQNAQEAQYADYDAERPVWAHIAAEQRSGPACQVYPGQHLVKRPGEALCGTRHAG